ncbi:hypothetical protein [Foetidibacter luteolus]|uniref:hypothetical protein n=1 Tax=Foetidibacter luteolus TaxID=2608880 RepID=UPI00129BE2DB|nr:hypothetical protein [Foetidibacter luteolus]
MRDVIITNPCQTESYIYPWNDVRKYALLLVSRYPQKYRLAYCNDFYQKMILLVNDNEKMFDIEHCQILTFSKIDASQNVSMLYFEMAGYQGNISCWDDFEKGYNALQEFRFLMKIYETWTTLS